MWFVRERVKTCPPKRVYGIVSGDFTTSISVDLVCKTTEQSQMLAIRWGPVKSILTSFVFWSFRINGQALPGILVELITEYFGSSAYVMAMAPFAGAPHFSYQKIHVGSYMRNVTHRNASPSLFSILLVSVFCRWFSEPDCPLLITNYNFF